MPATTHPSPASESGEPFVSLYRRFRPTKLSEIRGQPHVVQALRGAVAEGRVAHAYLFSGPRGTGKTSAARALAKALNCTRPEAGEPCGSCSSCLAIANGTSLDVRELDAASNNGVEAMRDLVAHAALATPGRWKLYIVDEVHMLSNAAANALLKTLEEPPPHVVFVLATTDPQKVPLTVRSRTQHYEFRLLGADTLHELLAWVRDQAGLDLDDEALAVAVRRGRGSARDALSALDQMASSGSAAEVRPELSSVLDALAALVEAGWSCQQLASELVDDLRQAFLLSLAPELASASGPERDRLAGCAQRLGLARVVRAMEMLGLAQVDMRDAPDARVVLELALVRLAHGQLDTSVDALAERLHRVEQALAAGVRARPGPPEPTTQVSGPEASGSLARADTARPTVGAVRRQLAARRQGEPVEAGAGPAAPADSPVPSVAAPPSATRAAASPPTDPSPMPERDAIVEAWGDHLLRSLPARAKALYSPGRFTGVEGREVLFALPGAGYLPRCEEVRPIVEDALSRHFGTPISVRLVVDESAGAASRRRAGPAPDPADLGDDDFDPADPGEPVERESLAHSRILEAFPGAEEVPE